MYITDIRFKPSQQEKDLGVKIISGFVKAKNLFTGNYFVEDDHFDLTYPLS